LWRQRTTVGQHEDAGGLGPVGAVSRYPVSDRLIERRRVGGDPGRLSNASARFGGIEQFQLARRRA